MTRESVCAKWHHGQLHYSVHGAGGRALLLPLLVVLDEPLRLLQVVLQDPVHRPHRVPLEVEDVWVLRCHTKVLKPPPPYTQSIEPQFEIHI
jgi:hypothetical protein